MLPTATPRTVRPAALVVTGLGTVLGVLALTTLSWFHGAVGVVRGRDSTVADIRDLLNQLVSRRGALGDRHAIRLGLSEYYYGWLAWVLLAAAVVVAVVAALPTNEGRQIRALGVLLAVLGICSTFWAVDVYRASGTGAAGHRPYVDRLPDTVPTGPGILAFLRHLSVGGWAMLAAFVLIGVGAALGPRVARTTQD